VILSDASLKFEKSVGFMVPRDAVSGWQLTEEASLVMVTGE